MAPKYNNIKTQKTVPVNKGLGIFQKSQPQKSIVPQKIEQENENYQKFVEESQQLQKDQDMMLDKYQDQDTLANQLNVQYEQVQHKLKTTEESQREVQFQNQELAELQAQLDLEIAQIEQELDKESQDEKDYYIENVLVKEFQNQFARKGPFILGIKNDDLNDIVIDESSLGINQLNCDRLIQKSVPLLDAFRHPQLYMNEMIIKDYCSSALNHLRFKNVSFICLGNSIYDSIHEYIKTSLIHLKSHLILDKDSIYITTFTASDKKIFLSNFPNSDKDLDKLIFTLKKLKKFCQLIQNDQEAYIINKKLNDFSKGCEETKKIMSLVAHKEQIILIVDLNNDILQNKELQTVFTQLRKIKFFNY